MGQVISNTVHKNQSSSAGDAQSVVLISTKDELNAISTNISKFLAVDENRLQFSPGSSPFSIAIDNVPESVLEANFNTFNGFVPSSEQPAHSHSSLSPFVMGLDGTLSDTETRSIFPLNNSVDDRKKVKLSEIIREPLYLPDSLSSSSEDNGDELEWSSVKTALRNSAKDGTIKDILSNNHVTAIGKLSPTLFRTTVNITSTNTNTHTHSPRKLTNTLFHARARKVRATRNRNRKQQKARLAASAVSSSSAKSKSPAKPEFAMPAPRMPTRLRGDLKEYRGSLIHQAYASLKVDPVHGNYVYDEVKHSNRNKFCYECHRQFCFCNSTADSNLFGLTQLQQQQQQQQQPVQQRHTISIEVSVKSIPTPPEPERPDPDAATGHRKRKSRELDKRAVHDRDTDPSTMSKHIRKIKRSSSISSRHIDAKTMLVISRKRRSSFPLPGQQKKTSMLQCSMNGCVNTFKSLAKLQKHIYASHCFSCGECGSVYSSEKTLDAHYAKMHDINTHIHCKECDTDFVDEETFQTHRVDNFTCRNSITVSDLNREIFSAHNTRQHSVQGKALTQAVLHQQSPQAAKLLFN